MSDSVTQGFAQGTSLADVVEATYNDMSAEFQARIPAELLDDISAFGNALSTYAPGANEFIYSLINHIGMVTVNYRTFKNPLAMFKRGKLEFGDTIEDVYVDVIKGMLYESEVPNDNPGDQWQTFKPDIDVIFHKINKELVYPITVNEMMIRRAFRSYRELDKFLAGIMQQLYNADEIDDLGLTLELLGSYANVNGVNKYYQVHVDAITSEATAKSFITVARAMHNVLKFPSRKFNAQGVMNWVKDEDIYFFVTPQLLAYTDVNVLASAFHMDKAEFLGRIVEVPEFPNMSNVVALMVDRQFLQLWDTDIRMATTGLNARHLTTNYYYHHQGILSLSPFYTAIAFTTASVSDVSAVSISGSDIITKGQTQGYTASVTGGATATVEWEIVGNPQYASINQAGNLTVGKKFAGNSLTLKAVSVIDASEYDTKEIVVRGEGQPTAISISGDSTCSIPASGDPNTKTYTATVTGDDDNEVTWSLKASATGVSISDEGVLSVATTASAGKVTVVATSVKLTSLKAEKEVTLS